MNLIILRILTSYYKIFQFNYILLTIIITFSQYVIIKIHIKDFFMVISNTSRNN